jgi:hypothetical protein
VLQPPRRERGAIRQAERAANVEDVLLDRANGQPEVEGDLFVDEAVAEQGADDLDLGGVEEAGALREGEPDAFARERTPGAFKYVAAALKAA